MSKYRKCRSTENVEDMKMVEVQKRSNWCRPFLYFDHFHIFDIFCTSTHRLYLIRPKPYFDFFGQTLLRPKLYFELCFSTTKKSRFDKRSKYRGRSTEKVELMRTLIFRCLILLIYSIMWGTRWRYKFDKNKNIYRWRIKILSATNETVCVLAPSSWLLRNKQPREKRPT